MAGYQLTQGQMDAIREVVRHYSNLFREEDALKARTQVQRELTVILDEDAPAASDRLAAQTTYTASVYVKQANGTLVDTTENIEVVNRTESTFEAEDMLTVRRIDGEWRLTTGGGGGSHHIWFTIQEVTCHADDSITLMVLPTWYTGGCNGTIPGEDSYGEVEVIDPCNILQLYTVEFLEAGAMGRATYMYPVGETGSYCDGEWILDTICGQPECA